MKITNYVVFNYLLITILCLCIVNADDKVVEHVSEPKLLILKGATKELANQCEQIINQILKRLDKEIEIKGKLENIVDNPVKLKGPVSKESLSMVEDIKRNIQLMKKESAEQLSVIKSIFKDQLKECSKNKQLNPATKENIKKTRKMMRGM